MALISQNSKIILITTSRLVKKNGVENIIEAIKYLPSNVELMIVGDGEEAQNLKRKAQNNNLKQKVKFLGSVEPDKIPQLLKQAHIFVRPSLSEGLGNSFLEAMAADLPIIGTPVGGIPDFLQQGVTGWYCKPNNPKSIAEAVMDVIEPSHQAHVREVINNARKLVAEKYSWDKIARQYEGVFI